MAKEGSPSRVSGRQAAALSITLAAAAPLHTTPAPVSFFIEVKKVEVERYLLVSHFKIDIYLMRKIDQIQI